MSTMRDYFRYGASAAGARGITAAQRQEAAQMYGADTAAAAAMHNANVGADAARFGALQGTKRQAMENEARLRGEIMGLGSREGIAAANNALEQNRLAQQDRQFAQTYGLDAAKAQESSIANRALLAAPEYGTPSFNPLSGVMESAVKRQGITGLAPSPLATISGGSGLSMESDASLKRLREEAAARDARASATYGRSGSW